MGANAASYPTEVAVELDTDEPFGPTEADLAAMFGGASPLRDEDTPGEAGDPLPELDVATQRIPLKTQVLMEELFRARFDKVQRVNPKKIR